MSTPIVAGSDLKLEAAPMTLALWRAVESQHRASTMVLVDTLDEQALLEAILDDSKPPIPEPMRKLHWLLFTPFRYPPLPSGSRFRAATDPGVFYGANERRTACAELAYWRWRFLNDSPALESLPPMAQTLFRTAVSGEAIDLRMPPLDAQRATWTDPVNYSGCQELARSARNAGVQLIRYESVRDPLAGPCAAVLSHVAFAADRPDVTESWTLAVTRRRVVWRQNSVFEDGAYEFASDAWHSPNS
jgi:hypothetical protein